MEKELTVTGAISISEDVAEEAKKLGIGLLRQVGEGASTSLPIFYII